MTGPIIVQPGGGSGFNDAVDNLSDVAKEFLDALEIRKVNVVEITVDAAGAVNARNLTKYFANLKISGGLMLDAFDAVIKTFFGFSPVEEWVVKPFSGDWDALEKGAAEWRGVGKAFEALQSHFSSEVPQAVDEGWSGKTRDAFVQSQQTIGSSLSAVPPSAAEIAAGLDACADLAQRTGDLIKWILGEIADWAARLAAENAVPVVGQVVAAVDTAAQMALVIGWINDAVNAINDLITAISAFSAATARMSQAASELRSVLAKAQAAG